MAEKYVSAVWSCFLPFRRRAESLRVLTGSVFRRIGGRGLRRTYGIGHNGGRHMMGLPLAVSCGIGGIGDIRAESLCPDLPALQALPVTLLATAFKDVLDIPASIAWLAEHGVTIYGVGERRCTGYLFQSADVPIDALFAGKLPQPPGGLILNPIPKQERIGNIGLLTDGIAAGKQAEADGHYYHPAANAAFDYATGGRSSRLQLESLVKNVLLADALC